ncbi:CD320 antigen isoform X1 [Oxyura jamaicensis]|uniref:CD320 antigen isoform X1 n=1 Tax=Oxyura jamaicensis TaxID=8884 RepID=UPI0015A5EBD7|nr:CD320 antigen isoform X1 [Oxyura jamaicensis]
MARPRLLLLLLLLLPALLLLLPPPGSGESGRAGPSSPLAPAARSPRTPSALIGWRRRRLRCAPRGGCGGLASGGAGAGAGVGAWGALAAPLSPSPGPAGCGPGLFRCEEPRGECFPREWICDGHPDCLDERDERGCEASGSPAGPGAGSTEASATPVPGHTLPSRSQSCTWVLIIAVLLSCLVAVGGVVAWAQSKAKSRSDIFSLEEASTEEQLISDKSQAGLFS